MSKVERVYIGGLEKERLQVAEVVHRLKANLQNTVEIVGLHERPTYFHVNVQSKCSEKSAFESIKSQFHNVKWKGCRLKVELAKPHYLERLAEERRQRDPPQPEQESYTMAAAEGASTIPRHLKIRRGYGEKHWRVDTRPCHTESWDAFRTMRNRLRKKQETPGETNGPWNRSVHLRFEHEVYSVSDEDVEVDSEVSSDETVCDSIGSSSSFASATENSGQTRKVSRYVWSDDDDSTDATSEQEDANPAKNLYKSNDRTGHILDDFYSPNAAAQEAHVEEAEEDKNNKHDSRYVWSDDESTGDEDCPIAVDMQRKNSLKAVNAADEFAAGMEEIDVCEEKISEAQPTAFSKSVDIREDVQDNLKILAEIFPDLSARLPHDVKEQSGSMEKMDAARSKPMTGWGDSGQMLRYDPSQNSAEQFHQNKGEHGDTQGTHDSQPSKQPMSGEHGHSQGREQSDWQIIENQTAADGNIYHQSELEHVFKAAREIHERPFIVESNEATNDSGTFAFGFQLGDDREPVKERESFSFSFPLSAVKDQFSRDEPSESSNVQLVEEANIIESTPKKRRRIGWSLPNKEVDEMVHYFFSMNDGQRIMNDLEAFRNDSTVQEKWNKERKILTEDWKRKRKYAVSRKEKRFR